MEQYALKSPIKAAPALWRDYCELVLESDISRYDPLTEGMVFQWITNRSSEPLDWMPLARFEKLFGKITYDKDHIQSMSLPELAGELRSIKEMLEFATLIKTEIQKTYDYISISVIPDVMVDEGVETMNVTGVGRLQFSTDIRCSVLSSNRELLKCWLRDNGHGDLVSESINSSTLKAFIKEMIKKGGKYPSELVKIDPYSRATVVKSNSQPTNQ